MQARKELTKEEREELVAAFEIFDDKDKDNKLDPEELLVVMKALGRNVTAKDLENQMRNFKLENDREVKDIADLKFDQDEFIAFITQDQSNNNEELVEAFRAFGPHDEHQQITRDQLRATMEKYGEKYSNEEFEQLFQENDMDQDGYINFQDFVRIMMFKQPQPTK